MSVAKVIEITASSPTSFAEAVKVGITKASETVHGIKGAWVSEESVVVENNEVTEFRVPLRKVGIPPKRNPAARSTACGGAP